jgi:hypothetical protein
VKRGQHGKAQPQRSEASLDEAEEDRAVSAVGAWYVPLTAGVRGPGLSDAPSTTCVSGATEPPSTG